jgi:acetyltransferase-like isoleucine patch superfamily enzyme
MNLIEGRYNDTIQNIITKESDNDGNLIIGSFCSIADEVVVFLGSEHRVGWFSTFQFGPHFEDFAYRMDKMLVTKGDVVIGNDVWIGYRATIMSGITIGDGAIISANAHVVKNVEPYSIVGGNPASFIRYRFSQEVIDYLLALKWWDLELSVIEQLYPSLCAEDFEALKKKVVELNIIIK